MSSPNTIADTIAAQLGGTRRLCAMIGAKHFIARPDALTFQHMKGTDGATWTRVTLAPDDTYTVEIGKVRKYSPVTLHKIENVHVDTLRNVIESKLGLYLSMGTMGR